VVEAGALHGFALDSGPATPLHFLRQNRGGRKGARMRRFLAGLLLGLGSMYWYAYQKEAFVGQVKTWFAQASHDAGAPQKVDKLMSGRR